MSDNYRKISRILTIILVVMLTACQSIIGDEPTEAPNDISYTQAAETIVAALTENAPKASPTSDEVEKSPATATQEVIPPSSTPLPTETMPPTSTPSPTETEVLEMELPTETSLPIDEFTPTALIQPNYILAFEDDFRQRVGWPVENKESFDLMFSPGGYTIKSRLKNDLVFSVRSDAYANVRLDVDGLVTAGSNDSYYGVICRFMNGGNYYILAVGSDGWYGIGKKVLSQLQFIGEGVDTENIIYNAFIPNQIRAECIKDKLTLYINDEKMLEVFDNEFTAGRVGLVVGNRTDKEVSILFDNFAVYQPE